MIVFATAIVFMAFSVVTVFTPLRGEEEFVGQTFSDLQAANPQLADSIWHVTAAIGIIVFGVSLLIALLAWKELSRGSRVAWYSIFLLAITFVVASTLPHAAIGHPSFAHWGPPVIITAVLVVGLAISAKPVFSQ